MATYHPYATAVDISGNERKLLLYGSLLSISDCFKQFDFWEVQYGLKIKTACVQIIGDGGTVKNVYYKKQWVQAK